MILTPPTKLFTVQACDVPLILRQAQEQGILSSYIQDGDGTILVTLKGNGTRLIKVSQLSLYFEQIAKTPTQ